MLIIVLIIILVILGVAAYFVSRAGFIAPAAKWLIYVALGLIALLLVAKAFIPDTMERIKGETVPTLD